MNSTTAYPFIILAFVLSLTQSRCTTCSSSKSFSDRDKMLTGDKNRAVMDDALSETLQQNCSLWLNIKDTLFSFADLHQA